jgi:DNA-binding NtrC family response regulator
MKLPLIAVVDDEIDLLDNFRNQLSDQFEVRTFSSPQDFLQALPEMQSQHLKLLISDFKMPGMTGLEMIQKAHEQAPFLPFIILSGFLDKKTVMAAVEMGVFRLLEKPCQPDELLSTIDQLLVESELQSVRLEIRQITSQLRELYSSIRIALLQHIPEELMDRLVLAAPQKEGGPMQKLSFEQLLENLEHRLDQLLNSEKVMHELATRRTPRPA